MLHAFLHHFFFRSQGDPGSWIHSKGEKGDRGPEGSEVRYDKSFISFFYNQSSSLMLYENV